MTKFIVENQKNDKRLLDLNKFNCPIFLTAIVLILAILQAELDK